MATPNGFLDSDDELFVDGGGEDHAPFTFQSDISDDDGPEPLALNEIASVTLAALNGALELGLPPKDDDGNENDPRPATKHKRTKRAIGAPADKPRKGVPSVAIEVQLPWLSPAQRAAYQTVSVEAYRPGEDEYLRTRRKRRGVSCIRSCH
jgi:hypothetical protein